MTDVPPARQCTLPSCEREAIDPTSPTPVCEDHLQAMSDGEESTDDAGVAGDRDHENPIDVSDVVDDERADMLREYLEAFVSEFDTVPRLMPLDSEGKAPVIQGRCRLDSPEGREYLVDGEEAIRQIREEGARGFALYAGKRDHGTHGAVFVDHDDDSFPTPTGAPTLEVLSGSGRGAHETYQNDPEDPVANARVGDNVGEIRAENWYVVAPGSVHPSGGVYHVVENREVATLSDSDLDDSMRPSTGRSDKDVNDDATAYDKDGDADLPDSDELSTRLEAAFSNPHDGEKIEQVYNGRYAAAGFSDRSGAEYWLANRLDSWVGLGSERTVRRVMDRGNLQKWDERTDRSYRDSILADVGRQDWYFDPEGDGESEEASYGKEPVSALPLAQLDALDPQKRRRFAKRRGLEWPTTERARDQLFDTISDVIRHEDDRVVDAPTSLGKTHTVAATRWGARPELTGDRPVVHLLETRDARDEAIDVAVEKGGQYHVLLGRHEACPVAAGEYDDDLTLDGEPAGEWLDGVCDRKGLPFSTAHRYLEEHNDQGESLPCCDDGECHGVAQWETYREGPEGELDHWPLVIATHNFAFAPGLRTANNIVIDEQPSYEQDLTTDRVRKAVGAFLREINAPVETWEAFIQLSRIDQYGTDAASERDAVENAIDGEPDREWYFNDPDAHVLAPALARAIFRTEDRANGRRFGKAVHEPPRLEAGAREEDDWNREWVSVVLDETNDVRSARVVPDFGSARAVVGLDAHPATPLWQANTVPWIKPKEVLEPEARQLWRRYERGLRVVQVGDATRPLSGSKALEWLNEDKLETLCSHLVDEYGTQFRTCITTAQVEDPVGEIMDDAGCHRPELMHFGEEKSRNDFATERIGLVNGCMDPGDDYVLDLLAELDLQAEPETAIAADGEEYRARGRGFDGPDAGTAGEILASVRENHTAQAAGRYARNPTDPDATATVFVRTDAVPERFADVQVPGVEWVFGADQREVVEELRSTSESKTAKELADSVGCSKEHVRQTLKRLADPENGTAAVQVAPGEGENGATLYSDTGLPHTGVCDLGESPTEPYGSSSMWELAVRDPSPADTSDSPSEAESPAETSAWNWSTSGDAPPDTAD